MDDDELTPDGPPCPCPCHPHAPFTPEDGAYAAIVSEYAGLHRAGASPVSAALITAAHLLYKHRAGQRRAAAGPGGRVKAKVVGVN